MNEVALDHFISAACAFAPELLAQVEQADPTLRATVDRAVAAGATLVAEVRFDVAAVVVALALRRADGASFEIASCRRQHTKTQ